MSVKSEKPTNRRLSFTPDDQNVKSSSRRSNIPRSKSFKQTKASLAESTAGKEQCIGRHQVLFKMATKHIVYLCVSSAPKTVSQLQW